jgi:DnaJ family protein C protein 7
MCLFTDDQPRRTPGIRKAKARTAATPFSAATAAANGFAAAAATTSKTPSNGGAHDLDNNEDGMAWSPSNTTETTTTTSAAPQQQQQAPLPSFLFGSNNAAPSSPSVGRVAHDFTTRLKVDEQQKPGLNPFAAAAAAGPAAAFTFNAGSPQQAAGDGVAGGVRPRRRGTPHRPAPPPSPVFGTRNTASAPTPATAASGPPNPPSQQQPAFVFQAKPVQPTTAPETASAAAAPKVQPQQQPAEGFISLSQFRGTTSKAAATPGAPLRRGRPRTKPQQQQSSSTASPTKTRSRPTTAGSTTAPAPAAVPNGGNVQWNAPAASTTTTNGTSTTAPFKQYQQHHQHPGIPLTTKTSTAFVPKTGFVFGTTSTQQPQQQQQQQQKPFLTLDQQAQVASSTADKYRMSGNDSFRKQKYEDAYKQYTQALNTLMPYPTVHTQLSLLLSNRAAAALALCRPLQALQDCRMGLHHDKNFLKCATRMATCHCRLGEYSQAQEILVQVRKGLKEYDTLGLKEVEGKEIEIKESMAMMVDMLTALGYSQIQVAITSQLAEEVQSGIGEGARGKEKTGGGTNENFLSSLPEPPHPAPKRASLEQIYNHLSTHGSYFPHAEMFHAAKAETLLRLGRYKEALSAVSQQPYLDVPASKADAPWRTWIRTQVAFYQGKAAETQELLNAIEGLVNSRSRSEGQNCHPLEDLDSIVPLPSIEDITSIRLTLQKSEELRKSGNTHVKNEKYQAAVDAYSEALSSGALSPALAAILYCNRAAAHQGLGNIALAVADCCRAKALHPGYAKAHSRLAALLTELGMYSAVVDELNAAIASHDITLTSKAQYKLRLQDAKVAAAPKRTFYGAPIHPSANHYKVLGLERGCAADSVRKVYKKLALQLHPDKSTSACRVSFKICGSGSGSGGGSELSDPATETQKRLEDGASWVFKCLGEANETLSSQEKRRELDAELSAWEDACASSSNGGGRGGGRRGSRGGGGDGFTYADFDFAGFYSPGHHHPRQQQQQQQHPYGGAYYRPHAQPSYNFNRHHYGGGSSGSSGGGAGGGGGGFYRHQW